MSEVTKYEKNKYLPDDVNNIIAAMVKLRLKYNEQSRKLAQPRVKPNKKHKSARAEKYPKYPVHTIKNEYHADEKPDKNEEKKPCGKDFNDSPTISGGFTHITCMHGVCKGFTAMQRGESPQMIVDPLMRRFPTRVRARHRYCLYDFACQVLFVPTLLLLLSLLLIFLLFSSTSCFSCYSLYSTDPASPNPASPNPPPGTKRSRNKIPSQSQALDVFGGQKALGQPHCMLPGFQS